MEEKKLSPIEKDIQEIEGFLNDKNPETGIIRRLEPEMEVMRRGLEIDGYNVDKALLAYRTAMCIYKYNTLRYQHALSGFKDKNLTKKIEALWDLIEEQKARLESFFRPLRSEDSPIGECKLATKLPNFTYSTSEDIEKCTVTE